MKINSSSNFQCKRSSSKNIWAAAVEHVRSHAYTSRTPSRVPGGRVFTAHCCAIRLCPFPHIKLCILHRRSMSRINLCEDDRSGTRSLHEQILRKGNHENYSIGPTGATVEAWARSYTTFKICQDLRVGWVRCSTHASNWRFEKRALVLVCVLPVHTWLLQANWRFMITSLKHTKRGTPLVRFQPWFVIYRWKPCQSLPHCVNGNAVQTVAALVYIIAACPSCPIYTNDAITICRVIMYLKWYQRTYWWRVTSSSDLVEAATGRLKCWVSRL